MTNGSVQQQKQAAENWMNNQAGARMLQRLLIMVPGVCDELAGCWLQGSKPLTFWGPTVFANWDSNVVVFSFPPASDDPLPNGPLAGRLLENFLDLGDYLRAGVREILSTRGLGNGDYDLICHSMGSLDAFAALVEVDPVGHPVPPDQVLPACHTFIAVDSPWYGVENMDVRRWFPSVNTQRRQCKALDRGSPLIQLLLAHIGDLTPRVMRVLTYSADTVLYPEVGAESADIYRDRKWRETARQLRYNDCLDIEGAAHSGEGGITNSSILIRDVFMRLGEVDAPLAAPAPQPLFAPMPAVTRTKRARKKVRSRKRKNASKKRQANGKKNTTRRSQKKSPKVPFRRTKKTSKRRKS